jgi:chloramphenicol-sensitive protein RarD
MLQYIAPSLQLLLGVWLYREPFDTGKAIGYVFIWIALAVFTLEGRWQTRGRDRA